MPGILSAISCCRARRFFRRSTIPSRSAGAARTLLPYSQNITDGSVTWKLLARTSLNALQIDTGSVDVTINAADFTGPYQAGIYISNTLAGVAPQNTVITDSAFAEAMQANI